MRTAALALAILTASLTACSGLAAKEPAEKAVARFHQQLDTGAYGEMYDEFDTLFQSTTTREQWIRMAGGLHDKLGNVVSATQTGFFTQEQVGTNAGSYIQLSFQTVFTSGKGTERFNYRVDGDKVRLVGYNLNSPDLLAK